MDKKIKPLSMLRAAVTNPRTPHFNVEWLTVALAGFDLFCTPRAPPKKHINIEMGGAGAKYMLQGFEFFVHLRW